MKKLSLFVSVVALVVAVGAYTGGTGENRSQTTAGSIQGNVPGQHKQGGDSVLVIAGNTACNPRVTVCEE